LPSTPQTPVTPSPRRSGPYVSTLEQQIRATRSVEERAELITELARTDSAEAVLALERLFTIERHPKVQTALIASLLDVDPTIQPDARLRILRAALTNQPRDVRTTALEVLAESDDPAARELLRKSSISDPDHEVREVAAALYKANSR
jgi:predicted nucleic acid-binding protein